MARPPKPTALKLVAGNPGKRALNKQEPDPAYLQDLTPPDWLPQAAQAVWREEAPKLQRAKLLTEVDTVAFAALCVAVADFRRAVAKTGENHVKAKLQEDKNGDVQEVGEHINPWYIVQSMSQKSFKGWAEKFGMTPQDRTRISLQPQGDLFGDQKTGGAESYFS